MENNSTKKNIFVVVDKDKADLDSLLSMKNTEREFLWFQEILYKSKGSKPIWAACE